MLNLEKLFGDLIKKGDFVLLHSNTSRLYRFLKKNFDSNFNINDILESFISLVGEEGTIMFPLFNFGFCNGETFDIKNTISKMGIITECARKYPKSVRTGHPVYSFAIIGKYSKNFIGLENISGYGSDSPFATLLKLNGKIAVLDLQDQESMTFYHFVEEFCNVDYRYYKNFTGNYIDNNSNLSKKTFKIYVRDYNKNIQTHVNPMGEILWKNKIYKGCRPNVGHGLRVASAKDIFNTTKNIILSGKAINNLYIK